MAELSLARWLPLATAAAPLWANRVAAARHEPRELTTLSDLTGLAPARELDLVADDPGASATVMRPTERQVKTYGGADLVGRVAGSIRRQGVDGKRRVILQEYQPVDLRRAGASGEVVVASSRSDLDRLNRVGARAARVLGLTDRDVLLGAVPVGPTLAAAHAVHFAQGASITALHARGHGDELTDVVAAARLLPTTVLLVPLDDAIGLAHAFAEERVALPRLRRVVTYGPPVDEELRAELTAAYAPVSAGADVRALWSAPFSRTLWAECDQGGHGLHTVPDLEVLEVIDPMTGVVTDADGDLTLTSSGWHGTALVRLRTGVWVDPLRTDPCPGCGRTVPRLVGDVAPWAWQLPMRDDGDTTRYVDLRGVVAVLEDLAGVSAWRAELRGPTVQAPGDRLVVEVAGDLARAQWAELDERLEWACGVAVQLTTGIHPAEVHRAVRDVGGIFADLR